MFSARPRPHAPQLLQTGPYSALVPRAARAGAWLVAAWLPRLRSQLGSCNQSEGRRWFEDEGSQGCSWVCLLLRQRSERTLHLHVGHNFS